MKDNAEKISSEGDSGARLLYREFMAAKLDPKRVRLHLIGHSAGAIVHSYLADAMAGDGWTLESVTFMAPAVNLQTFQDKVVPHLGKKVKRYVQLHLTEQAEEEDPTCKPILYYQRSLLHLVANSFEKARPTEVLGLERDFLPWLKSQSEASRRFVHHTSSPGSLTQASTHGAFDDDPACLRAVLDVVKGKRPPPSAPPGGRGRGARGEHALGRVLQGRGDHLRQAHGRLLEPCLHHRLEAGLVGRIESALTAQRAAEVALPAAVARLLLRRDDVGLIGPGAGVGGTLPALALAGVDPGREHAGVGPPVARPARPGQDAVVPHGVEVFGLGVQPREAIDGVSSAVVRIRHVQGLMGVGHPVAEEGQGLAACRRRQRSVGELSSVGVDGFQDAAVRAVARGRVACPPRHVDEVPAIQLLEAGPALELLSLGVRPCLTAWACARALKRALSAKVQAVARDA